MYDFTELETRLNGDPKQRDAFLTDPVAFLVKAGFRLSLAQQYTLRDQVFRQRASVKEKGGIRIGIIPEGG